MKNNTNVPVVAGSRAKENLLRCICPFCGEPHFHANAGPHLSQCKNLRLQSIYLVIPDGSERPEIQQHQGSLGDTAQE